MLIFVAASAEVLAGSPGYVGLAVLVAFPYGLVWPPCSEVSRRIAAFFLRTVE